MWTSVVELMLHSRSICVSDIDICLCLTVCLATQNLQLYDRAVCSNSVALRVPESLLISFNYIFFLYNYTDLFRRLANG